MLVFINFVFFQWFFCRLTRVNQRVITSFNLTEVSLLPGGNCSIGGHGKSEIHQWYSIQFFILPLSGWWGDFVYCKYKKFIKISKVKIIHY